ncbi:MAG: HAMP domain-containing sensor histidine kinase [Actinomycetota bacterium]
MIRRRLVASILAVVAGVTGLAGVLIIDSLERRLLAGVDRELETRRVAVAPPSGGGFGRRPPLAARNDPGSPFDVRRYAFVLLGPDGRALSALPTGPPDDPGPLPDVSGHPPTDRAFTVGSVGGSGLRYRAIGIPQADGGTLVAGIPLAEVDYAVRTARGVVFLAWLLAVAATGIIVWVTVRRGLRPIDQMIGTAERIAEGELSQRAPVPVPRSEVGHLARALNVMLDRIEEALAVQAMSEARSRRFAADASHELRTPLTSIRGYAELYRQGARSEEEVVRAMARIEQEALRMGSLVEDLLLLARLDQGRPLAREPVDLVKVALEAVAAAGAVEPDRPIRVEVGGEPVEVLGDAHRLRQVFDNLLANVREHTLAGTPASVHVGATGGRATIVVADEGPGMTSEEAARAFDRFWQAGGDTSPTGRGAGLGLSIVADIVAAHGGEIRLHTVAGQGATFTVSLPQEPALS